MFVYLNKMKLSLPELFGVYGTGELGHLTSPNRLVATNVSTAFRASPEIWGSL